MAQRAAAVISEKICEQIVETQQLIQLSRQGAPTVEQTQSPDDRFTSHPYFDPAATSFSK